MKTKILILFFVSQLFNSLSAQDIGSSKEDFLKMANYLSADSGKWFAPNPKYEPENLSSTRALGLWFNMKLKQNLLHLSLVIYKGDTAHITADSFWLLHPGEQRIKYYDINSKGDFIDGENHFASDEKFITRLYSYAPDGHIQFERGENIIISKNEHKTKSSVYEKGKWREIGSFTWKRTVGEKNYKVLKHH